MREAENGGLRSRRSPIAALTLVVAAGSLACGPDRSGVGEAASAPEPPSTGGTAVVGVAAAATTPFPPLAAAALDFELGSTLYPGLNYGEWSDGRLEFIPGHPRGLAREWSLDLEGARLEYRLDGRKRWSDGRPITARDVQFTYELLADTALALPLSSTAERIDSVVVVDDSTVVFHFDAPYPGMLFDTGVGILPSHVYDTLPHASLQERPADGEELVVSGPFRLERWAPASRIVLVRNEASDTPARLDRLVIEVLPEETTRLARLRAGTIDAAQVNSFREAGRLADSGDAEILRIPQRGYDYIAWNGSAHPALSDVRVRHALSLAIDREAAIEALDMSGYAEPAWGPYGSLFSRYRAPAPDTPLYDPTRARALLDEAGWVDGDGDGVRERDGIPLAIALEVPAGNDRRGDAAEIVQAALSEVGVDLEVRPAEFNALFGRMLGGEFEAALMGWQVALDPDIGDFWLPRSPLNVTGLDRLGIADAVAEARAAATREVAAESWRRVGSLVSEAYPYAFLWFFDVPFAVGHRLRGVEVDATGWAAGAHRWGVASAEPTP